MPVPSSSSKANPWRIATIALFVLLSAVILRTFGDYGMSWDEHYRQTEGAKKLAYYQNWLSGNWQKYDNPEDNYPGFFDLLHQSVNLLQPFGPGKLGLIFTGHFLTAIFGLFTILAAYKIGKQLGQNDTYEGERTGFFAALFLALFPHFYGHMFFNPKDIPFACMYLWSIYITLKIINKPLTISIIGQLCLTYGLTLGTRLGGVFLFAFMALAFAIRLWLKRKEGKPIKRVLSYAGLFTIIVISSFALLLPWWPFAHPNPLGTIIFGIGRVANYPWNGPVVLNGHVYPATDLPWFYLPEMLLVTTPIFIIILGLFGIALALHSFVRKAFASKESFFSYFNERRLGILFVAFAFFFPIVAVIVKHATLYDGIRHFLFVLGLWAILSSLALNKLLLIFKHQKEKSLALLATANSSKHPLSTPLPTPLKAARINSLTCVKIATYTILALGIGGVVKEYLLLHPYQYVYFNSFVGGEEKAWKSFDTEYWGTSHREAVKLLTQHLENEKDTNVYKVNSPMAPWLVEVFLPDNLLYTNDLREADFFISFLRFNAHMWSDGEVMEDCVVIRNNTPIAIVRDRRAIKKQEQAGNLKGRMSGRLVSTILNFLPSL